LDPLVNPGMVGTPHTHQIVGGNSFKPLMKPLEYDQVNRSTCTSCTFSEDFSNYWTAALYFRARNGTYKRVRQVENGGLHQNGGMTVYYIPTYDGVSNVTAFTPGFRMLAGNPTLRNKTGESRGICHRCLFKDQNPFGGAPCTGNDTTSLPDHQCAGGIRTTVTFPTCWDGKNLDSPDHKSHVAYPTNGPATFTGTSTGGACPSTHPVKIPQLMLEIVWDTRQFNNRAEWPEDGSQPFVLSTGDPTGYGQHGDYVFGWKGDSLQKAMEDGKQCMGASCGGLKTQAVDSGNNCKVKGRVREDFDGWMDKLPGM
jgi:hypothetical protein